VVDVVEIVDVVEVVGAVVVDAGAGAGAGAVVVVTDASEVGVAAAGPVSDEHALMASRSPVASVAHVV